MYENAINEDYHLVAEAIPQIIWMSSPKGRVEYFNSRFYAYTGLTQAETAVDGWQQAMHPDELARMIELRVRTLESGNLFEMEHRIRRHDGEYRWFLNRALPVRTIDGRIVKWFGTCTDIHDQKRAQEILRFFARAGNVLGASLDPRALMVNLASLVVPEMADYCQVLVRRDDELLEPLAIVHVHDRHAEMLQRMHEQYPLHASTPGIDRILGGTESSLLPEITEYMRRLSAADDEHFAMLQQIGARSSLVVPLDAGGGRRPGLMSFVYTESNRRFTQSDLPLYLEIGRRAAVALENAMQYQREHHIAKTLQEAMLPRELPSCGGARFFSAYIPAASELHVGGDWYDAFALPGGRIGISIGDVIGHGLDAAIVMGEIRQALRSAAIDSDGVSYVLDHADRILRMQRPDSLATAGFGVYDAQIRTLIYSTAGHPPPLVWLPGGDVFEISAQGLPLGMRAEHDSTSGTITLPAGALVVFYTDGLVEFDRNGIDGERILREAIVAEAARPSANRAMGIYRRVVVNPTHADDTAILVLQVGS
ncbi:MAG: SpoIIE family protein phosphatase [Vulcanimicrobiaceae bacterium]